VLLLYNEDLKRGGNLLDARCAKSFERGYAMLSIQRHTEILAILARESVATVRALAQQLGVAESTVRRDLDVLEEQGLLKRTYGGAMLHDAAQTESIASACPDSQREVTHADNKEKIGRAAAALVKDNEAIFLDSGTTTACIVPHILDRKGLTVVTCDLNIAVCLAQNDAIATIVIGGELHIPTMSFTGSLAQKSMELFDLHFSKAFIGVRGVAAAYGITNRVGERIPVKQLAIQRAREVIVVADGSKIGALAPSQVAPITAMHHLVTDSSAPTAECEAIAAQGVDVIVVS
jgi:DeoR/GlpR family transcriptional regulator of sugar metabolism